MAAPQAPSTIKMLLESIQIFFGILRRGAIDGGATTQSQILAQKWQLFILLKEGTSCIFYNTY